MEDEGCDCRLNVAPAFQKGWVLLPDGCRVFWLYLKLVDLNFKFH